MASVKANISKMYAYKFFVSLSFLFGVLIPFFLEWGQISFFQIMILQSWFVLWVMVLEIPTGAIADYLGRKPTLTIAAIINAIGILAYTSVPNFYAFMLGEFLWALALAMMSGADEAMIYDSLKAVKKEKTSKKILGRFGSFEMLGIMIAAPIGSIIAATLGLRWTVLLMAIPFATAFLIALTLKEPVIRRAKLRIRYLQTLKTSVRYFYSHKILRILAFDSVSIAVLVFLIVWLFQPKLLQLEVGIAYFGIIVTAMTALEIAIMNNFGRLEKFAGSKKRYLLISALIAGTGFILLGLTSNDIFSIVLIILIGGFGIPRYILFSNYMNKYIASRNRATVLSTIAMFESLGLAIAYPIVGLLAEWSLNYTLIIIGALTIFIAIISGVEEGHLVD